MALLCDKEGGATMRMAPETAVLNMILSHNDNTDI
jgi:hypothetical protein